MEGTTGDRVPSASKAYVFTQGGRIFDFDSDFDFDLDFDFDFDFDFAEGV